MSKSVLLKKLWQRPPTGLIALVLGSVLIGSPVRAATFNVNDVTDAGDANPGDGVCASILFGGPCTLRAAIQEANALPGLDAIYLPTLTFFLTISGSGEDGALTGDLDITDSTFIQGTGSTIIDATGLDDAFDIHADLVQIDDLEIRGAGIRSSSADAYLDFLVFKSAGLRIAGGTTQVYAIRFEQSGIINQGNLDAQFVSFISPPASGILNQGGTAVVEGSEFIFGAIGVWNQGGTVQIRDSTFDYVQQAIVNFEAIEIARTAINESTSFGIYNDQTGRMILTDSRVDRSSSGGGGAIQNRGFLLATNLQMAFNSATASTSALTSCGAGLYNYPSGVVRLAHATFSGNSVGTGPAGSCSVATGMDVLNLSGGYVAAHSTLFLSNAFGKPACSSGAITSQGYNSDRGTSCGLSGTGDVSNAVVALTLAGDDFLEPSVGSIAIGSGPPSCRPTDARGFARKTTSACDRGAVEHAAALACANGLDDDGDGLVDLLDPGCSSSTDPLEIDFSPGDILLTSVDGSQLFSVDPVSGRREVVAASGGLSAPTGVVQAADGSIYVASLGLPGRAGGPLMRIDPETGEQTVAAWDESTLASVTGMLELPNGNLAVTSPGINEVVEVDPATGAVTTLATGPVGFDPRGISRDPITGRLFVAASSGADRVFEILGGVAVPVALAGGASVGLPRDLAVVGDQAYITDSDNSDELLRLDLLTGMVTSITTLKTAPRGVGIEADGSVLVADRTANELVRVDPDTGAKEIFAIGPLIDDAYFLDIVESPEPCEWTRYADQARFEAAFPGEAEVFDFSTVALDGNGDAGFSNGHDFGPFTWTSLTVASDIDLFGSLAPDGTLHVTSGILPPQIQGWPGGIGGAGTPANDDDFRLDFAEATTAAGIEILDNRVEGGERVEFRDDQDQLIASFELPGDASGVAALPDGNGFVGLEVCPGTPMIRSIVVKEGATVGSPANDNIGFTNVVYVPEPARLAGLGAGLSMLVALGRRRRRCHETDSHLQV